MVGTFVGRKPELALLTGMVGRLEETGRPVAALVVGDPGSGKTRLLSEVRTRVTAAEVHTVAGYEAARDVPLAGAADLLRSLTGAGDEGARLNSMLYGETHPGAGPELLRIYESAHRCLSKLDRVLIFADDLQWLDQPTLVLCRYLVRAAWSTGQPVGLIAAARPCAAAESFAGAMKQVFVASDDYAEVVLDPLARSEGVELAQALLPALSDEKATEIWDRAGGSPFWVELLVRTGSEDHVGRVITDRLRGIDTDAASLMTLLVVAARPVAVDEAAAELDWETARVDFSAAELVGRGVILRSVNNLVVVHDLVRSAVTKEVPAASARAMHVRLARYLEKESDDLAALAEALVHRRAGGIPTLDLALALVRSPRRRLLGLDVLALLEAIADEADPVDPDVVKLNLALASLAAEFQQHDSALRRFTSLHETLSSGPERSEAALGATRAAFELGRSEEARRWLDAARESSGGDEILAIELDVQDALLLRWGRHDPEHAHKLSRKALVAARRLAHGSEGEAPDGRRMNAYLVALRAEFDAAFQSSDVPETMAIAEEMSAAAQSQGEQRLRADISTAVLMIEAGRVREALERFEAARAAARRQVLPKAEVEAAFYSACCLRYLCRFAAASEPARSAKALADRVGTPTRMSVTWVRTLDHLLELSVGGWQRALTGLEARLDEEEDPHYRLLLRYNLAVWSARLARPTDATRSVSTQFELGRRDAEVAGCRRCRGEFELRLAEALVRTGGLDAAADLLAGWDEEHPRAHRQQQFLRGWAQALIRTAADGLGESVDDLEELAAEAEEMGFVLEGLWVGLDLGRALVSTDPKRAVASLKLLADRAGGLGATNEEGVALRALRGLGVRTWRRTARGPDSLSPREREVAHLVAAGATNPEIAATLFLARKTVERHVSNILAKTGARNRTELAGRLSGESPEVASEDGGAPR